MDNLYVTAIKRNMISQQSTGAEYSAIDALRFLYGLSPTTPLPIDNTPQRYLRTHTREMPRDTLEAPQYYSTHFNRLIEAIRAYKELNPDRNTWYHQFFIPKNSGGFREINAPNEDLKLLQKQVVHTMSTIDGTRLPSVFPHDSAYAYVEKRSTKDALIVHQVHGSNWFLKMDLKDFFPSCTLDFVVTQLQRIYPLAFIPTNLLTEIVDICCLNGALPQGSPASPFLTNILMIPVDKAISDELFNLNQRRHIYTRYADDLLISSREEMDVGQITGIIQRCLEGTPFQIKETKTRYGSRAGRNWNLGIMLNKDNGLTLGYKFKQRMRAAVYNFLMDHRGGTNWDPHDVQILTGQLGYMEYIEPGSREAIIQKYEAKTGMCFSDCLRAYQ